MVEITVFQPDIVDLDSSEVEGLLSQSGKSGNSEGRKEFAPPEGTKTLPAKVFARSYRMDFRWPTAERL